MEEFIEYCKKREGELVGSQLDNEDLIDYKTMRKYWNDYVKLFLPVVGYCKTNKKVINFKNYDRR